MNDDLGHDELNGHNKYCVGCSDLIDIDGPDACEECQAEWDAENARLDARCWDRD